MWLTEQAAENPDRLWGVKEEPRPLAVQMWDNNPATLAKVGARLAHEKLGIPLATIHLQNFSGHVAGALGRQETDNLCDLVRSAEAPHGNVHQPPLLLGVGIQVFHQ